LCGYNAFITKTLQNKRINVQIIADVINTVLKIVGRKIKTPFEISKNNPIFALLFLKQRI